MVFVSYARENQDAVASLAEDLRQVGNEVWLDRELSGGRAWWDHILSKIRECDIYVFALSAESLDSQACGLELLYASQLGKSILPALVADGVAQEFLPPALAAIQYVDYRLRDKQALLSLIKALSAVPRSPALPDPLPPPPAPPVSYLAALKDEIDSCRSLSFAEQSALLLKLKQALGSAKTADLAVDLLQRFRARDDLFARVAAEIDAALASSGASSPRKSPDVEAPGSKVPSAPGPPGPNREAPKAPPANDKPPVAKAPSKPVAFAWAAIKLVTFVSLGLCFGLLAATIFVALGATTPGGEEYFTVWFASSVGFLAIAVLWRTLRARKRQRNAQAP